MSRDLAGSLLEKSSLLCDLFAALIFFFPSFFVFDVKETVRRNLSFGVEVQR